MDYIARYRQPSRIDAQDALVLVFMASTELAGPRRTGADSSAIFSGRIAQPLIFRNLLLGLRQTVESRFYRPDLWRLLDPVITSGQQLLRLECFSSCASVYARADLTETLFEKATFARNGTTNVDFNGPFLNHLAQLRPGKPAHFEMGEQSVTLQTQHGAAVEHKVKLPERWIKGFLQVQAVQRQAQPLFELDRLTAGQLLTQIPAKTQGVLYLVPKRHKPEILHRQPAGKDGFIAVTDGQRLRLLHAVLPDLQKLRVYRTEATGASLWVADAGVAQFTLGLSGAAAHGFSGDGDALRQLRAVELDEADLALARAAAYHLNQFTIADLAQHQDLPLPYASEIVDRLSQQGLLGFDRDRDRYFYRQLPFLLDAKKQPERLQGSRALLAKQAVEIEQCERRDGALSAKGWVRGESGYYQASLRVDADGYLREGHCTCPWIQKHDLRRGPCKHLLALRFVAEQAG
ncbi:MAG TPA: SWIM zinc finger family protein [Candidatus Competibacter sp.]|nr:SWIM zinc finger family protein [Candidatus Competibacter sp.]